MTNDECGDIGELWERLANSDGIDRGDVLVHLGGNLLDAGQPVAALAAVDAATDLYEAAGDRATGELALAHHNAAFVLHTLGRLDAAAARHERAVDAHLESFHRVEAGHCLRHTGDVYVLLDDPFAALARYDRAVALLEAEGEEAAAGHTLVKAATVAFDAGKPGWARDRTKRARSLLDSVGDDAALAEAVLLRVELLADAGLDDDTIALAEGLREELRETDDPASVARCDVAAGRALLRLGERDRAAHVLESAVTVFDALGRRDDADAARRLLLGRVPVTPAA